ncbi:MAG: hypothetical protein WCL21_08055 [Mariniphaga sp.]
MTKLFLSLLLIALMETVVCAQNREFNDVIKLKRTPEPFLFSITTLTPADLKWSIDYSASYGERISRSFGNEGIGQQFGIKGYLGSQLTLYANASLGFTGDNKVTSAQRAEIIRDFIGGKKNRGFRLGLGVGIGRDYFNVKSFLSRITASYDANRWKAGANLLVEKAFAGNRDAMDIITTLGFHYRLLGTLYGGFETAGEDLEGFLDPQEAEGGAKLLLGPSINMTTNNSRLCFSVSGGPVFYGTHNKIINTQAIRYLPSQPGLTLRAKVIFNLSQ